jgi:hypothetical protein
MPKRPHQAVLPLVIIISTIAATFLLSRHSGAIDDGGQNVENRQSDIIAIPLQLRGGIDGIAIIDKSNYTICIYQYQGHRPDDERFVLLSARSFRYDRLLQDYNTAEPRPDTVKQIIEHNQKIQKQPQQQETPEPATSEKISEKSDEIK